MNSRIRKTSLVFALAIVFINLYGCSSAQPAEKNSDVTINSQDNGSPIDVENDPSENGNEPAVVVSDSQDSEAEVEQADQNTASDHSGQPVASPTPDTRLLPEDWRDWDVVPQISPYAIEIYERGLVQGNNPAAFSKIGDCQAISEVLLGIYDHADRYQLSSEQQNLQATIDNYQGSFDRDGMAVKGGFNAAAVLSPMWADPDHCKAGETPIECEFRVHKPSMVIISLEVWWEGRTVERYEEYMRRIIDYSIEQGVLPILSTKADNVEKDHSINLATAKLAYEYDIPLWNFWKAVQSLPYKGIDPTRDGFHITTEAWTVRSYTALQTLNAVLQAVNNQDMVIANIDKTAEEEAANEDQKASIDVIRIGENVDTSRLAGYQGQIIFDITSRVSQKIEKQGVYILDLSNGSLSKVIEAGYSLQSVSPDGRYMLVNQKENLYRIAIDTPADMQLLSEQFYYYGTVDAVWDLAQNYIYAILMDEDGSGLWRFSTDGSENNRVKLTDQTSAPVEFIASMTDTEIYWKNGTCSGEDECSYTGVQAVHIDDLSVTDYPEYERPVFTLNHAYIADRMQKEDGNADVRIFSPDQTIEKTIQLPADRLFDYSWSLSEDKLMVMKLVRSDYSGKTSKARIFAVQPGNWLIEEYPSVSGISFKADWSPGENKIVVTGINQSENGEYYLAFYMYDAGTKKITELDDVISINSDDYFSVNRLYWMKHQ